jgi:hypothetical protein
MRVTAEQAEFLKQSINDYLPGAAIFKELALLESVKL